VAVHFTILGSGSGGNCAYLEVGETRLLIDAGFSAKQIRERLASIGRVPEGLTGILVTHEYGDHCSGLPALLGRHPGLKVFANRETARRIGALQKVAPIWQLFETGSPFEALGLAVTPFALPHDAADPVGFAIRCPGEGGAPGRKVTWMTDLGHVTPAVRAQAEEADILVLESNYDDEMLDLSQRPAHLKQRIRGHHGHLSNLAALDLLRSVRAEGLSHLCLGHLSKECNRAVIVDGLMGEVRAARPAARVTVFDPLEDRPAELG